MNKKTIFYCSESLNEYLESKKTDFNYYETAETPMMKNMKNWLNKMGVKDYKIEDYKIHVNGDVNLRNKGLKEFPEYINFKKVEGTFSCESNQLESLRGVPQWVGKDFICDNNNLDSVFDCPEFVGGNFYCRYNNKKFEENEIESECKVAGKIII